MLNKPDAKVTYDTRRPGDVSRLYADTTKARKLLGFKPKPSLRVGLGRLRDWYLSLGKSPAELLKDEVLHNWKAKRSHAG